MIEFLSPDAFRPKALACIREYWERCAHHSLTVGVYDRGLFYVFAREAQDATLRYDVGSISKTVTAHLILSLAERGKLDLSRSVDAYLSLPKGQYPTVYQLLSHTAGYTHVTPIEVTLPAVLGHGYVRRNVYARCDAKAVLKSLGARRRKGRGKYSYSDFGYAVLALVAEAVEGKPFAELYEQFVRDDLGLSETQIAAAPDPRRLHGAHKKRAVKPWEWQRENPYIASGGLVSSVTDMLRYLALQIESDAPYITKAHQACPASVSSNRSDVACLGWHTYKHSNAFWHVGGVGSFQSSVIFHKKRRIGVVVLGNARGAKRTNAHYLAKMLLGEMKSRKIDFTKRAPQDARTERKDEA